MGRVERDPSEETYAKQQSEAPEDQVQVVGDQADQDQDQENSDS